ncbi:MAG TPA: hypothetical protein VFW86_04340, partial [Candidatus Limnocylindrales bacterium]|nr:hypothetical protein [Candidatus Limnocylindrales bacterium]
GLRVEPTGIVGLYSRTRAAVVVVAFEARIVGGELRTNPEALAFGTFAPEGIPWSGIAFRTTVLALRDWIARARPDLELEPLEPRVDAISARQEPRRPDPASPGPGRAG